MSSPRTLALIDDLRKLPAETSWVEFKENNADAQLVGMGTLYSYFSSKEELFCEAVLEATAREAGSVFVELHDAGSDAQALLMKFGASYLQTVYSPRFQALRRLVFSATFDSDVGRTVYEKSVKPYEMRDASCSHRR